MQYLDELRQMNKEELETHIEAILKQIETRKSMPESAKLDHLFGGSPEKSLAMARHELLHRFKEENEKLQSELEKERELKEIWREKYLDENEKLLKLIEEG